ncbi:NAD-dependent protein deacetylase [bacterium BMS3Bbin02]|nr:NAD-dependent protein deacetylase [bacterium BMS3Bbin02]
MNVTATHIAELAEYLRKGSRILVFTGAGVSTTSGIPDYRGPQGVWKTETPVFYQEFMTDYAERVRYWQQKVDADDAWGKAQPNGVHRALVDLERAGKLEMVVTQNVDGLHSAAGTSDERLVEIHGTVRLVECQTCGEETDPEPHYAAFRETGEPPVCHCGGLLKPATISFGQNLDVFEVERARSAALSCDLVLALGSTLSVYPAAAVPLTAAERGVPYVIVNRGATDHDFKSCVSLRIDGDVSEIVPPAVAAALA